MIFLCFASRDDRWRLLAAAGLALALVTLFFAAGAPRLYRGEAQLLDAMRRDGFQRVGRFGSANWPAIVVGRDRGEGGVRFVDGRGQAHEYRKFAGPMQAIRLHPLNPQTFAGPPFVQVFARLPPRGER